MKEKFFIALIIILSAGMLGSAQAGDTLISARQYAQTLWPGIQRFVAYRDSLASVARKADSIKLTQAIIVKVDRDTLPYYMSKVEAAPVIQQMYNFHMEDSIQSATKQTLSINGNNLSISLGNTVTLPTNTGPQGPSGANAVNPNFSVNTGAAGGNVSISGSYPNLTLTIPRGADGSQGSAGSNATNPVFAVATGTAGTNVSISGTYPTLTLTIPRGNTGANGSDANVNNANVLSAIGYTPYNGSTNPNGYISSVPAQAFASLTGKPTSLLGYGITDAYPLSTNPAGYITGYDSVQYYSSSGRLRQKVKTWEGIITPTTASGQTIDISSAGFSTITNVQLQAGSNTNTVASIPFVSLKSYTTTQIVCNIVMSNNTTVSVLNTVVSGLVFATPLTGITVHVRVDGY